jgi:Protein of unknown function (DUF2889)
VGQHLPPVAVSPGRFRRRVEIATRPGVARAVLEDDFHHFRVEIEHHGGIVRHVAGQAPRYPFTTCPSAAEPLIELVGMRLAADASAVRAHTEQRLHCTHLLDLAGLAIAAAARGLGRRRYDATVQDRIAENTQALLLQDDEPVMTWDVERDVIRGPHPYAGVSLRAGFVEWAIRNLEPEASEAAIVLRRAVFVSRGRGRDLDAMATAPARGGCYTQQPHRAASALRVIGSTRDFTHRADLPAAGDAQWLGFDMEP